VDPAFSSANGTLDVSVILPVFNERGHVLEEITRIRAALDGSDYSYEIIAIDDGSTDGSGELLLTIDDIRVIRFQQNRGTGTARKIGTRAAQGRYVVWTDADMSYPNERIPELVKECSAGYDQVVGARTSEQGTNKALRVPAKWFIRKLACYLSGTNIPDLNSGLRVFRRDVALQFLQFLPRGFSCVTTMTMTFLANGYTVGYVPIEYSKRAGKSKFHWWADTRRYLLQVVRMILSYEPLRVFGPIGLALALLGVGKGIYDVFDSNFHIASNTLLIFFAAFQLIAIGFLADLVVRVNRPRDEVQPASQ
jgi:glycosyltransferase involved in cell wall biosynthesis